MNSDKNIILAGQIAEAAAAAGGRAYYVGGFVRDRLMQAENKDVDIEVHGISFRELEQILSRFGEQKVMGASFGIFGLKHYDLDIAMPRSEKATGRGHKDFEVYVDPFIGPEKAALRRDFTINAMMQDVLTGEVLDFYGGREDLEAGLIRHVNDATFVEDPLRVLRAAQFAARFEFRIADETRALCRGMDLTALSKERIMGELEKALLKARSPSVFFEELGRIGQLKTWFPEIAKIPEMPEISEIPEISGISGIPEIPETGRERPTDGQESRQESEQENTQESVQENRQKSEQKSALECGQESALECEQESALECGRESALECGRESTLECAQECGQKGENGSTGAAAALQESGTFRLLDNAAALRDQAKEPLRFMLSALCAHMGRSEPADAQRSAAAFLDRLSTEVG